MAYFKVGGTEENCSKSETVQLVSQPRIIRVSSKYRVPTTKLLFIGQLELQEIVVQWSKMFPNFGVMR
jgi:hypothetical protein